MFHIKKKVEGVAYFKVIENYYFVGRKNTRSIYPDYFFTDNDFANVKEIGIYFISGILETGDALYFVSNDKNKTYKIAKDNHEVIEVYDICLSNLSEFSYNKFTNEYLGNAMNIGFVKFNFEFKKVTILNPNLNSNFIFFSDKGIVEYSKAKAQIFYRLIDSTTIFWQAELSELGTYKDIFGKEQKGEIKSVELYEEDKVIVIAGSIMICYELATGRIVWQLKIDKGAFPHHLLKDGNIGYSNGGAGYYTIDLANGKFLPDAGDLENFMIEGETILPYGRALVLHEGLLWHSINNSGINIIAAIEPATAKYVWWQKVETSGWIESPKFHQNKMYILSSEGELLIYEKE